MSASTAVVVRDDPCMALGFYDEAQAAIHDERFGDLARDGADALIAALRATGITEGTVVELGCGSGISAMRLLAAGYGVVGCDLSPAMVELAGRRAPDAELHVASAYDLALPYCVGVLAVGEVLNYRADGRAGLEGITDLAARVHDALLRDGVFLFDVSTPGRNGPDPVERQHEGPGWLLDCRITEDAATRTLVREIVIQLDAQPDRAVLERHELTLYDEDEVRDVLSDAGFDDVRIRTRYGDDVTFSTPPHGMLVVEARRR